MIDFNKHKDQRNEVVLGFMEKKKRNKVIVICLVLVVLFLVLSLLTGQNTQEHETIKEAMRDAVLHDEGRISLLGITAVNPALFSGFVVTGVILIAALFIRIFIIPKFKIVPGKFQMFLETIVGLFDDMAKSYSPHRNKLLGAYIFGAGTYICLGTLFELLGFQAPTVGEHSRSIALCAPLADINGAIAVGCFSYLVIMSGGIASNGLKGIGKTLKEFSLPISMSFRLFGALLSGLLVTELVYFYITLSFVLPVVVGVMFTLLHALIQAYVLTMLTAMFYGEVSEVAHSA